MKVQCPEHGAHFGDEVGDITSCTWFWAQWGLKDLPGIAKQELAEWLVELPADKIFIETGWGIGFLLNGEYLGYENSFAQSLPGYSDWSEDERREYQRSSIKQALAAKPKKGRRWFRKK